MKGKKQKRELLYGLLGDLPDRDREISVEKIDEQLRGDYLVEFLSLDLNGFEPVPAYFVRPKESDGPLPAILFNHSHGCNYLLGKNELLNGSAYLCSPPYAQALTQAGYAGLCIDHWAFWQRYGPTESAIFKEMLWNGQVMWGMMVYDSLRAMDYLVSRDDVESDRIGTLGLSMGSTMAYWVATLDERAKVCVDICCLTDYEAIIKAGGLDEHGIYYYVPSLMKHFTAGQINALIAPRAHLGLAGNFDTLTPVDGLELIDAELRKVYIEAGAAEAWQLLRYNVAHIETPAMRKEIMSFLKRWL